MSKLFDEQSLGTSSFYWWLGQVVDDSTWRDNINPKLHEDPNDTKGWGYRYKVRIFGNQSKDKQTEVTDEDVYSIITLCLRHRLRKDPMATIDEGTKVLEVFSSVFGYDSEE